MESKQLENKVASAMAGQYDFSIKQVVDEAWETTRGFKLTFWATAILYAITVVIIFTLIGVLGVILGKLMGGSIDHEAQNFMEAMRGPMMPILVSIIVLTVMSMPIILSLGAGFWMVGIHRAGQNAISPLMVYQYFDTKLPLFLGWLYIWVLTRIAGFFTSAPSFLNDWTSPLRFLAQVLLFSVGLILQVYVIISYIFFTPLVAEKKLPFWQALEASRQSVWHRLYKIMGLLGIVMLVLVVPMTVIAILYQDLHWIFIALSVIYIWLAPFALLALSILYREMFGIAPIKE